MPQTMTLPEKIIDYIGYSDAAMEQATAFQKSAAAKQAAADALIPAAVEALVSHERLKPAERAKAAEVLKDHAKCVELLTKLAGHRNATELSALGTLVDEKGNTKTAGANGSGHDPASSLTSAHVGGRSTRTKQSDVNFLKRLGLDPTA